MKNVLFLVFGVLFRVYGAATHLETLKKVHPCFFERDTSSTDHLHLPTHYPPPFTHVPMLD